MKKIIVRILGGIGALLVLGVLALVMKFFVLSPKSRPAPNVKAPATVTAVARGNYLANNVAGCISCHSPTQESKPGDPPVLSKLGGGRDFGDLGPKVPFHLRAPNLTPDKETGIGNVTDGELLRSIREGIGHDGRALFPQMPYPTYARTLSDDDALAIIAYLRTLEPVHNDAGHTTVDFPVSMFIRAVPTPLENGPPPPPPASDKLAHGKWLLDVCSCHECHDSFDERKQPIPGKSLAGGFKFAFEGGKKVAIAPNITSDKATGIGAYSDDDLRRVFDEGKNKQGRPLYVMPWTAYQGLTTEDKDALFAALRDVPAVSNIVPPSVLQP